MPISQHHQMRIALIALSVVVALLLWLGPWNQPDENPPAFAALSRDEVTRIQIDLPDSSRVVLDKTTGGWYATQPWERKADPTRINVLLATLSVTKGTLYHTSELNLAEVGLEPAQATLTLNNERFFFGHPGTKGERRYLQVSDKVALVPDIIFPMLKQGLTGIADKKLIPPGTDKIKTPHYTLDKTSGEWRSPDMAGDVAHALVAKWHTQQVTRFIAWPPDDIPATSMEEPPRIVLTSSDNLDRIFEVIALPDQVVIYPLNARYAMTLTPDQLVELGLAPTTEPR